MKCVIVIVNKDAVGAVLAKSFYVGSYCECIDLPMQLIWANAMLHVSPYQISWETVELLQRCSSF